MFRCYSLGLETAIFAGVNSSNFVHTENTAAKLVIYAVADEDLVLLASALFLQMMTVWGKMMTGSVCLIYKAFDHGISPYPIHF
jgi:hypothetical protein